MFEPKFKIRYCQRYSQSVLFNLCSTRAVQHRIISCTWRRRSPLPPANLAIGVARQSNAGTKDSAVSVQRDFRKGCHTAQIVLFPTSQPAGQIAQSCRSSRHRSAVQCMCRRQSYRNTPRHCSASWPSITALASLRPRPLPRGKLAADELVHVHSRSHRMCNIFV
jgi:hypothetical protein